MMRMKASVEKEHDLKLKREELRLLRQKESQDRKWRQNNLEKARIETQKAQDLQRIRRQQLKERQEIVAA